MSHEFDDSEMYPCDRCGEGYPRELMYELDDGSIVCENCIQEIEEESSAE